MKFLEWVESIKIDIKKEIRLMFISNNMGYYLEDKLDMIMTSNIYSIHSSCLFGIKESNCGVTISIPEIKNIRIIKDYVQNYIISELILIDIPITNIELRELSKRIRAIIDKYAFDII